MNCKCKSWKMFRQYISIDGEGVDFVYCPWCGRKLTEKPIKASPMVFSVGQSVRYKDNYLYQLWGNGHIVRTDLTDSGMCVLVIFGDGSDVEEVVCSKKDLRPMT